MPFPSRQMAEEEEYYQTLTEEVKYQIKLVERTQRELQLFAIFYCICMGFIFYGLARSGRCACGEDGDT
jgi:hypothetical protein